MTSFAPTFLIDGKTYLNAQRFATYEEARESAHARFMVWTQPMDFGVVETPDPVNYAFVDGRATPIGEEKA